MKVFRHIREKGGFPREKKKRKWEGIFMKHVRKIIIFMILALTLTGCGLSTKMSNKKKKKETQRISAYLKSKYPGVSFSVQVGTKSVTVTDENEKETKELVDLRTATDANGITFALTEVRDKKDKKKNTYDDNYCDLYNQHFYETAVQEYVNACHEKYHNFSYFSNEIPTEEKVVFKDTNKMFSSKEEAIDWYCTWKPLEFVFGSCNADSGSYAAKKIQSQLQEAKQNTLFRAVWIKYDNQDVKDPFVTYLSHDLTTEEIQEELEKIRKH